LYCVKKNIIINNTIIKSGGIRVKNVRKLIMAAAVAVFTVSAVGCNMVSKTPEAIKKSPVAKFGKVTITKAQLDEKMTGVISQIKAQYGDNYETNSQAKELLAEQKKQVLESLIAQQIVLQKAQEKKLVPEEAKLTEEVNKQYDDIKKAYTDETKFKDALKQAGYTDETLKAYIKDNVIIGKVTDDLTKDVKVEDAKIKEYYDAHQTEFTEKPNRIHVAHILSKTEADAKKVKERLDKGEDFAKVAKEVSTEEAAKESGGDLGFIEYSDTNYDKTFMTAAISTPEGTISQPIQTSFGWHVIKDIKKEEYPVKKFDAVKEEIKTNLLTTAKQTKVNDTVEQWKKDANVKYYEKNM
jgi:foldase protein PrsA